MQQLFDEFIGVEILVIEPELDFLQIINQMSWTNAMGSDDSFFCIGPEAFDPINAG